EEVRESAVIVGLSRLVLRQSAREEIDSRCVMLAFERVQGFGNAWVRGPSAPSGPTGDGCGQLLQALLPARVGELARIADSQDFELVWKLFRPRHSGPFNKNGNDVEASVDGRADLGPHQILWVIEPPTRAGSACGLADGRPGRPDHDQNH